MPYEYMDVETYGDKLVFETAFGTATFELSDSTDAANEQLLTELSWMEMDLSDRWEILTDEVETAVVLWKNGDL